MPSHVRRNRSLSAGELDAAKERLLHLVQRGAYARDLERLQAGRALEKGNQLSWLTPCLDDGLLVVGGRLQASELPHRSQHPVILLDRHHVTILLIRHAPECSQHSGVDHVLAVLRQKYWITSGRAAVKRQLKVHPLQASVGTTVDSTDGATVARTSDAAAEAVQARGRGLLRPVSS